MGSRCRGADHLRVAWFTSVEEGAVAEFSRGVLAAMIRLCEPRLFCVGSPERFPAGVPATNVLAEPQAVSQIPAFDAVFYNVGEDLRQQAWIFDIARLHPGIVVLHELSLHRFFLGYYLQHLGRPDLYVTRMAEHYGTTGLTTAHQILGPRFDAQSGLLVDDDVRRYTFTEEALRSARGAVVHSRWHGSIVRKLWTGPVCEAWLPIQRMTASSIPPDEDGDVVDRQRLTLMTLGPVDPRTHVGEVINLLAENQDLADRLRYVVAGSYDPADPYVQALMSTVSSGLVGSVRMLGDLPPHEVDRWARAADVFINLRYPHEEGCLKSLMYELPFGKPVLVYDHASLAELPSQAVAKISTGNTEGLGLKLRELVDSAALREAIGSTGRRFADDCTARGYARRLLEFARQDVRPIGRETPALPSGVAEQIAIYLGETLSSLGATSRSPGVEAAIREATELLCPPGL